MTLSLDPKMKADDMLENLYIYDNKNEGATVSLDDIKLVIDRLRREEQAHITTNMMLEHSQERLSYLQSLARKMLEYD